MKVTALSVLLLLATAWTQAGAMCRTARELAEAFADAKAEHRPFDVEALVCYVRQDTGSVVVGIEDASGAAIAEVPYAILGKRRPLPGDVVRIIGTAGPDDKGRHVANVTEMRAMGHRPPPKPTEARLVQILDGSRDFRLTAFSGVLRDATASETADGWVLLVLRNADGQIYATVPNVQSSDFNGLIGRRVRLTGIPIPHDKSNRKYLKPVFKVATAKDVVSDGPESPIRDLNTIRFRRIEDFLSLERHSVTGRIIAVWEPRNALLDAGTGAYVGLEFMPGDLPAYGDTIRAVGLPESDLFNINLDHVTYEKCEGEEFKVQESKGGRDQELNSSNPSSLDPLNSSTLPPRVSVRSVMTSGSEGTRVNSAFHGCAIRISGIVRAMPNEGKGRMQVESDGLMVPIDASACPAALARVSIGCRVDVGGTCVMEQRERRQTSSFPQIKGFFIVVRTPDDVTVLSHPTWWTPARLWTAFGILMAALLGVLAWNVALRKVAARKGRELMREQIKHVKADLKTEERTRLAVELHDSLAQSLTGVSLEIDTASKLADKNVRAMGEHLHAAARALKSCRDELRNCLWDLRNRALEAPSMDAAIRQTLAPHVAGIKVAIRFNVPRERISDNTAHAVLRIVRELTLNGIRHGKATAIWIAGSAEGGKMLFSVRDNGCGFDPDSAPGFAEGHYGLLGIEERVDEFEGEFKVSSTLGEGTRATVALRMPQEHRSN